MGWLIKDSNSGMYLFNLDGDGYGQFSGNFNTAWWWESEDDVNWYISTNNLQGVEAADSGGSNPPGPGQPGQPG